MPRTTGERRRIGGGVVDDWHIRIEQRYLNNEAGAGAREKEREIAGEKGGLRKRVERFLDVRTEDRGWRRGAEGEERVAAALSALGDRWAVVHDLTVGRKGANLDHLVIGPPGVFVLNTKNLTGKLKVYEHLVVHNGHKTTFVPAALREARTVQERLSAAVGREIRAWSVLVVLGCEIEVKKPLANLSLVGLRNVTGWLRSLPAGVLTAGEVIELERVARTPGTWLPGSATARPQPPRSAPHPPAAEPAKAPAAWSATLPPPKPPEVPPPPVQGTVPPQAGPSTPIRVRRWQRFGKDRLYANGADGLRLGYLEVGTGEIVLEVADPTAAITAQLRASHRALGLPPSGER